jgi:hypothetical protein
MAGPDWQKGRFLTLFGNPIGPDGEIPRYLDRNDTVSVASTGLSGAVLVNFPAEEALSVTGVFSGVALFCSKQSKDFYERSIVRMFGDATIDKCIDTKPDEQTAPTSKENMLRAEALAKIYGKGRNSYGGQLILLAGAGGLVTPIAACAGIATAGPFFWRAHDAHKRFDNVSTGKWAIVDMPKLEKAQQAVPDILPGVA